MIIIDYEEFIRFYNATLKDCNSNISPIIWISKGKRSQITNLVRQYGSLRALLIAVEKMAKSDLCNGRIKTEKYPNGLLGSLAWLTSKEEIFSDVLLGKYDNPPEKQPTEDEKRKQAEEERQQEAEERRRKNLEIDQQIREEQRRAREEAHANRATPEQLEEIFKNFKLPPLKKNGPSPNPSPVRAGSSNPRETK